MRGRGERPERCSAVGEGRRWDGAGKKSEVIEIFQRAGEIERDKGQNYRCLSRKKRGGGKGKKNFKLR